jgi:hypothetical protein
VILCDEYRKIFHFLRSDYEADGTVEAATFVLQATITASPSFTPGSPLTDVQVIFGSSHLNNPAALRCHEVAASACMKRFKRLGRHSCMHDQGFLQIYTCC